MKRHSLETRLRKRLIVQVTKEKGEQGRQNKAICCRGGGQNQEEGGNKNMCAVSK